MFLILIGALIGGPPGALIGGLIGYGAGVARGLPESMRPVAEERSREINSAYDLIKAAHSDL